MAARFLSWISSFYHVRRVLGASMEKNQQRFNTMDLEHFIRGQVHISDEVIDADIF